MDPLLLGGVLGSVVGDGLLFSTVSVKGECASPSMVAMSLKFDSEGILTNRVLSPPDFILEKPPSELEVLL